MAQIAMILWNAMPSWFSYKTRNSSWENFLPLICINCLPSTLPLTPLHLHSLHMFEICSSITDLHSLIKLILFDLCLQCIISFWWLLTSLWRNFLIHFPCFTYDFIVHDHVLHQLSLHGLRNQNHFNHSSQRSSLSFFHGFTMFCY